ncbi:MAG: hypothetical protein WC632_04810 [Candidatus Margulisiibacteriota bacterium]
MIKDYRTKSFIDKYNSALSVLGRGTIQDVVSLKIREHCVNSSEYNNFINHVTRESGLNVSRINGQFLGNAHVISDNNNNVLVFVEHETGPEILVNILYVSGLIGLIRQIMQAWGFVNRRFMHRHRHEFDGDVEVRKFDKKNRLIEEHVNDHQAFILKLILDENASLAAKVAVLEDKLSKIVSRLTTSKKRRKK